MAIRKASAKRVMPATRGRRTIAGRRADALGLRLGPKDLDLPDDVITVTPTLRSVAALGQEARRSGLSYLVSAVRDLQACLGRDQLTFGNHRIDADEIAQTMPDAWFP